MAVSLRTRLKRRQNELRETRQILAKRSKTVRDRKRQQRHARKNLESAVKHHRPKHEIEQFEKKLAEAHELLDKAMLGQKGMEARERRIEKKIAFLQKKIKEATPAPSSDGVSVPDAPWNPSKRQISNSIIPWLVKTWNAGCHFSVTSGYRSPAYQAVICKNMCGNSGGCPGRCAAPGSSNHQRYGPGQGAVDVTNFYAFKACQYRIGSPLRNSLGAQDPVHFSFTGS